MKHLLYLLMTIPLMVIAQDMSEGFSMLETGEFEEAKGFFSEVLKDYPNNKTANLCYGRAVGLAGNPDESIEIFQKLLLQHKGDTELKLNLAESYLWKNKPDQAIPIYNELNESNPGSFGIQLGVAISQS